MINYKDHYISSFAKGLHYPENGFNTIDDPTFLGFSIMFHWDNSPLFKGRQYVDDNGNVTNAQELMKLTCAFTYLYNIGEFERMKYLKQFINNLMFINNEKGYYWQEIEGIDSVWEGYNDFDKLPIASYWEFSIKTLETVDMKVYGLMELLRKTAYDYENSRTVLPSNLQRFNMTIYVAEMRNFYPLEGLEVNESNGSVPKGSIYGGIDLRDITSTGLNDIMGKYNIDSYINKQKSKFKQKYLPTGSSSEKADTTATKNEINAIIIDFEAVKIKPFSGGDIFNSINNSSFEMASNTIKFEAKSVQFNSVLPWFNRKIENNPVTSSFSDETKWENIQRRANSALEQAARDMYQEQKRNLMTNASQLIRENIPGGLIGTLEELERGNILNAFHNIFGRDLGNVYQGQKLSSSENDKDLGNVYQGQKLSSSENDKEIGSLYNNEKITTSNNDLGNVYYWDYMMADIRKLKNNLNNQSNV